MKSVSFRIMLGLCVGFLACLSCDPNGTEDDKCAEGDFACLFPGDNVVSDWVEDREATNHGGEVNAVGVEIETTHQAVEELINGDAAEFFSHDVEEFGVEYYTNGTQKLRLSIWRMVNAAECMDLNASIVSAASLYDIITWTTQSYGDAGRSGEDNGYYYFTACKGACFIEVWKVEPKDAGSAAGEAFIKGVIDRFP